VATNHGKVLAIVAVYDVYLYCAWGSLQQEWKINCKKIMDFQTFFKERLLLQGLQYLPANGPYPGDQGMRMVTRLSLKQRQTPHVRSKNQTDITALKEKLYCHLLNTF
jgi:hypothetical protein